MKFEKTEVWGFEHAIRGMRMPKQSHDRSDSIFKYAVEHNLYAEVYPSEIVACNIGPNDLKLMQSLIKAGSEHRKFMRQIMVSVDITAPLYWWKEFDTYRIGVTENSTSTMHKLASTPITMDCFEMGDFEDVEVFELGDYTLTELWLDNTIQLCELLRNKYNSTKDKRYWKELIRLLPESWLQTRTVTMNYENILSMVHQRKNHKLFEWSVSFIGWAKSLPYADELMFIQ